MISPVVVYRKISTKVVVLHQHFCNTCLKLFTTTQPAWDLQKKTHFFSNTKPHHRSSIRRSVLGSASSRQTGSDEQGFTRSLLTIFVIWTMNLTFSLMPYFYDRVFEYQRRGSVFVVMVVKGSPNMELVMFVFQTWNILCVFCLFWSLCCDFTPR